VNLSGPGGGLGAVEARRVNAVPLRATIIESSPSIQWRFIIYLKEHKYIISELFYFGVTKSEMIELDVVARRCA